MLVRSWTRWMCGVALLALVGCGGKAERPTPAEPPRVKNIILMIGDGMGPQQVGLLEAYATRAPNSIYGDALTGIHQLMDEGNVALSRHHPADGVVVDSACSATQLAAGVPAGLEMVGLDAEGNPTHTIFEQAMAAGLSTGIISDTRLTHATPASFVAHAAHRSMENHIAAQMAASKVDVMLSGGMRHWVPEGYDKAALEARLGGAFAVKRSKRKDGRDLIAEVEQAGYTVATDKAGLEKAGDRVLGLFAWSGMADGITHTAHRDDAERRQPTLKEMTAAALERLSKNPKGFVLMVEGGQIDWAGHANDAGWMLHEMIKFDEAVAHVHAWARGRDDTLVVVTADHETGSFGLSYSRNNLPAPKKLPGKGFEGFTYRPGFNFGRVEQLDRLHQQSLTLGGAFKRLSARAEAEGLVIDHAQDAEAEIIRKRKAQAAILVEIFNPHSAFKIDQAQAERVLTTEPNAYHVHGEYRDGKPHKYMQQKHVPAFDDFEEFYVNGMYDITALLGRVLGPMQGVVWGTGTHTHTPVPVISYGPKHVTERFSGLLHHVEVGKMLIEVMRRGH